MTADGDELGRQGLAQAEEDLDSVVELTRQLVRIPSCGGIDPYEPILDHLSAWLTVHHLSPTILRDSIGAPVALACEVRGAHPGPRWVLDACLDTAPLGDETAWTHPPTSATIQDGWLWGRGSADSKSGAAIFCHIAARLAKVTDTLHGTLVLLFDVDEHTGNFGGAKRYFEGPDAPTDVAGVMIGYPGLDHLIIGSRGVLRARLHVHGIASHSGSRTPTPNAVEKAAHLIHVLSTAELPSGATEDFPLTGRLTVTAVQGGQGYSITPDLCTLNLDVRTTPAVNGPAASQLVNRLVAAVDDAWPGTQQTNLHIDTQWPAYVLPNNSPLCMVILQAAISLGLPLRAKISGPTNIGNYLAGLGVPATAGFGVDHVGLHGTDERIRIDSIPSVQATYGAALGSLCAL